MKKVFLIASIFILFLVCYTISSASDFTINGSARFKCNFLSKYMEKHGYYFITEGYINDYKTNVFAANNAKITVKNKYGATMATGITDEKGDFSFTVPSDNIYLITVEFNGYEFEYDVPFAEAANYIADLGYFNKEEVAGWLSIPRLSYCYSCNIRYLELRESF